MNQHDTHSLSQRGTSGNKSVLRVDMNAYFEAIQNIYHPQHNPEGTFPLNVAENKLTWHLLSSKIQKITRSEDIPDWVAAYTSGKGDFRFRAAVAQFMTRFLTKCPIDPNRLACSAGAASVIEMTAFDLCDAGDVAAFPAPAYPVYKQDIQNIPQVERYDIITHHYPMSIKNGFLLDIIHLEQTLAALKDKGKTWRMLVLTHPDNPTGNIYTYEQLLKITDWCLKHQIHLVVNEIYGLSLIDTQHPAICEDYGATIPFVSFAQIMEQYQSDYLHLWYAFSKDFGVSGFRVGLVYSYNTSFLKAYENLNYTHLVSNYAQWLLQRILEDDDFIQHYITENQRLLTESYASVVRTLKRLNIPYTPARGSLFVWLDLSFYLAANTQSAEDEFWLKCYNETGILLTPGQGFGHTKKGLFRLVHTCFATAELEVAMQRLEQFILTFRKQ